MKQTQTILGDEGHELTRAERIQALIAANPPPPKMVAAFAERRRQYLARRILSAGVSERMAEAVKANPASFKMVAVEESGVTLIERARANEGNVTLRIDMVSEVDAEGRPIYWDHGGVVHVYNPYETLNGKRR
jgi:hypothetical protein